MAEEHIAWVKEYLADELRELANWSLLERGAYQTLKILYYTNRESFLSEQMLFARCYAFTEEERTAVRTVVERLFGESAEFPFNKRFEVLKEQALKGKAQKSAAGKASGKSRAGKGTAVPTAVPTAVRTILRTQNLEEKKERKHHQNTKNIKTPTPEIVTAREKNGVGVLKNFQEGGVGLDILHYLSEDGLRRAKMAVEGWDIYNLARVYNEGIPVRGFPTKNPANAFIAWCKLYTKGAPP